MLPERDYQQINEALKKQPPAKARVRELIGKAEDLKGLSFLEAGELLSIGDQGLQKELIQAAGAVKDSIYGKRVVLFAPLYLSNECTNDCLYCGFRRDNKELSRRTLDDEEIIEEARRIEGMGHKRILLVCGEQPVKNGISYLSQSIQNIYNNTDIRRLNINVAPLSVEEFRILKEAAIGTYQLFQETYHPGKYAYYHPSGFKSDYNRRITALDRAVEAGIDDVGMGVLFGLYDYRYEAMALISHATHLEARWGVGPHTISVPRLKRAPGGAIYETGYGISDNQLMLVTAVLRLALPYTGIILSTREPAYLRDRLLSIGVSQISAGSSAAPGGYASSQKAGGQFSLNDNRSLDDVVKDICKAGYLPSFCTACYRKERTGERFMKLAKGGDIKHLCQPNALLTFKEFLMDYASAETLELGNQVIKKFLQSNDVTEVKEDLFLRLAEVQKGLRDIHY